MKDYYSTNTPTPEIRVGNKPMTAGRAFKIALAIGAALVTLYVLGAALYLGALWALIDHIN